MALSGFAARRWTVVVSAMALFAVAGWLVYLIVFTGWNPWRWSWPSGELAVRLFAWPILPNSWEGYAESGYLADTWWSDLVVDSVWMIAIPWLLFRLTVWSCARRPRV